MADIKDSVVTSIKGRGPVAGTGTATIFTVTTAVMIAANVSPPWQLAISAIVGFVFGGSLSMMISHVTLQLIEWGWMKDRRPPGIRV
jgi:hypothetical protein